MRLQGLMSYAHMYTAHASCIQTTSHALLLLLPPLQEGECYEVHHVHKRLPLKAWAMTARTSYHTRAVPQLGVPACLTAYTALCS
jgi:hypothetical protein